MDYEASRWHSGKESTHLSWETQETQFHPWSGKILKVGNGKSSQCSCLDNSINKGDWQATVLRVLKELDRTEQLTIHTHTRIMRDVKFERLEVDKLSSALAKQVREPESSQESGCMICD